MSAPRELAQELIGLAETATKEASIAAEEKVKEFFAELGVETFADLCLLMAILDTHHEHSHHVEVPTEQDIERLETVFARAMASPN